MKIIAFGYKKQRGKDTSAKFLKDWLHMNHPDLRVRTVGFADKLKDVTHQLYGWAGLQPPIYYETHYAEKEIILPALGMSPRDIWIGGGNKMREIYGPTWIHYITKGGIKCDVLLVKDMGFTNEAIAIREEGGFLCRLNRLGMPMADDPRETELDSWTDWDADLDNNGTLQELNQVISTSIGEALFG